MHVLRKGVVRYILIKFKRFVNVKYVPLGNALEIQGVKVSILNDLPVTGDYTINSIPANQGCTSGEPIRPFHLIVVSLLQTMWH